MGGTYGGVRKPTNFICLVLKMLRIQPDNAVIIELIRNESYKYVRILGAFYMRLIGKSSEVYRYLDPLYNDYRKTRVRTMQGTYQLSHVDEIIDDLLRKDIVFDTSLPRIQRRSILELHGMISPRVTGIENEFEENEEH